MASFAANEILGLQLALDPRKVQKPHIVAGRNFYLDIEGPRSGFGFESSTPEYPMFHKFFPQSFVVTPTVLFHFGQDSTSVEIGCYTFDWQLRRHLPIFRQTITAAYLGFPWTMALVGGLYYFAHRGVGVWQYTPATQAWVTVNASFPAGTYYIIESDGRCVAMADGVIAWSAIDNALDFVPSTVTGAGAQSLAKIGSLTKPSDYLGLKKVADGFLCFTSKGILKGLIVDSFTPFRFVPASSRHVPLNPWCFAETADNQHVILTVNGLYATSTGEFEPWLPLFSEYLKQQLLGSVPQGVSGYVQLHYEASHELLFVSFSTSNTAVYFTRAFCSYVPRGEIGSFDLTHTGFVKIDQILDTKDLSFGFIRANGTVGVFTDGTLNIENAGTVTSYLHAPRLEIPVHLQNAVYRFADVLAEMESSVQFQAPGFAGTTPRLPHRLHREGSPRHYPIFWLLTQDIAPPLPIVAVEGYSFPGAAHGGGSMYVINGIESEVLAYQETYWAPNAIAQSSLDASIELGLFRFGDGEAADQVTLITELLIGVDSASGTTETIDYLAVEGEVVDDFMLDYPSDVFDDYGLGLGTSAEFVETLIGTKDGRTAFEGQEIQPETLEIAPGVRRKTMQCAGIWHKLRIVASEVGHNFHIKLLEFTHFLIGRW